MVFSFEESTIFMVKYMLPSGVKLNKLVLSIVIIYCVQIICLDNIYREITLERKILNKFKQIFCIEMCPISIIGTSPDNSTLWSLFCYSYILYQNN